jgi:hypothetical protein
MIRIREKSVGYFLSILKVNATKHCNKYMDCKII